MKKIYTPGTIAMSLVILGVVLRFIDLGVFGGNPIPEVSQFHYFVFWSGVAIWVINFVKNKMQKNEN